MYSAEVIANYILGYYTVDKNTVINNFKLQKVLYFLQANHLVAKRKPLFSDEIEAWDFGPVIPQVYYKWKAYGGAHIPFDLTKESKTYKNLIWEKDQEEINELLDELEPYSATSLLEIIHKQYPWRAAYYDPKFKVFYWEDNKLKKKKIITNDLLYDYFKES